MTTQDLHTSFANESIKNFDAMSAKLLSKVRVVNWPERGVISNHTFGFDGRIVTMCLFDKSLRYQVYSTESQDGSQSVSRFDNFSSQDTLSQILEFPQRIGFTYPSRTKLGFRAS